MNIFTSFYNKIQNATDHIFMLNFHNLFDACLNSLNAPFALLKQTARISSRFASECVV